MNNCRVDQEELQHDINTSMTDEDKALEDLKKMHILHRLYDQAIDEECEIAIAALIEPVGNDDNATRELLKLMYLCGEDQTLSSAMVTHQLGKFIKAMDDYAREVI